MIAILATVMTAAASVAFWLTVITLAKWRARDLQSASEQLDIVYLSAQKMIKDDATPGTVKRFVVFVSAEAGTPRLARRFAKHLMTGSLSKSPASEAARQFADDIDSLSQEQKTLFARLVMSSMISSAASDILLSRIYLFVVRSFLSSSGRMNDLPSEERTKTVATDLAGRVRDCELVAA